MKKKSKYIQQKIKLISLFKIKAFAFKITSLRPIVYIKKLKVFFRLYLICLVLIFIRIIKGKLGPYLMRIKLRRNEMHIISTIIH